jgi:hypothetical protein
MPIVSLANTLRPRHPVTVMELLGSVVVLVGLALMVLGGLVFVVKAFRESILWGLGVLFLPFVSLIFLALHWRQAKDPFFLQLVGLGVMLLGSVVLDAPLPLR